MSDSEDPIDPIDEADDLFGDEDDEADGLKSPKEHILRDDDLASDPEEERNNYARQGDDDDEAERVETVRRIMEATAYRHPIPKPSDGVVSAGSHSIHCAPTIQLSTTYTNTLMLATSSTSAQIRPVPPRRIPAQDV